jgi:glycosyltransferase involved in cell wall biosynthesis
MFGAERRLKILLVSHRFPPHGNAGTETYTEELGLGLLRRGHDVHVFTSAKDIARRHLSVEDREHRGLCVHEVFNNLHYADFRETWDLEAVDTIFDGVLRRAQPDVVHFQHLMYLSSGCVERAARVAPVVFTLHDYWLECPRFGQRVHADGGVCHVIDFERCGSCLAAFKYAQSAAERRIGGILSTVRSGTGIDLGPLARASRAALSAASATPSNAGPASADSELAFAMRRAAEERSSALQQRVIPAVDLFLSPSRFLRDKLVSEWRVPAGKIEHLRFGVDASAFGALPRRREARVQVAFIGSLIPIKGPHLLLEAWTKIAPRLRETADLVVYGPNQHEPEYQRRLSDLAREAGAKLAGPLARDAVASVLARTDLLVVPSVWYENAPLVIHEALASRTPLLVADAGGMAELVEPGRSGFRFRLGDVDDLARALTQVLEDPRRLDALYADPVELPRVDEHLDEIEKRYNELVRRRARRDRA